MPQTLWIALGGALGTVARFAIEALAVPVSAVLPLGTIGINLLGSFVIGFIGTLTLAHGRHPLGQTARLFLMVGVCGGFTTFSSFSLESFERLRGGGFYLALANVAISVLCGLAAVTAGHALASRWNGGAWGIAQTRGEEE